MSSNSKAGAEPPQPCNAPPASTVTSGGGNTPEVSSDKKQQQARPKRARPSKTERKEPTVSTYRFHCDFCGRDLSSAIRARCAVCPDYDSCLDCFSVGATLNPHLPDHPYRLIQVSSENVYQGGWGADEEEKLLEGLEVYGVGNWEEVAKLIGTKNPLETEQHYMQVYLQSTTAPLPDPTKVLPAEKDVSSESSEIDPKSLRVMHMHQQEDAAGFMSKRGDFVYEWDNDAEEILGDIEISNDESQKEQNLKLNILEIYCHKLDERQRRKDFVIERGLTDIKANQEIEKKRSKDDRDLREKLKVFARFLSPDDFDKFVRGLRDERNLRHELDLYHAARLAGATTIAESQQITASSQKMVRAQADSPAPSEDLKAKSTPPAGQNSRNRTARKSTGHGTSSSISETRSTDDNVPASSASAGSNPSSSVNNSTAQPAQTENRDRSAKSSLLNDVELELMPGAELLSQAEISLCTSLKLTPHQYLIVKEVMIRESARVGCLKKKDAKNIIRLDATKVSKIFDYLLACGWIKSGVAASSASRNPIPVTNGSKR